MSNITPRHWPGREEEVAALRRGAKKRLGRGVQAARPLTLPVLSALAPFIVMTVYLWLGGGRETSLWEDWVALGGGLTLGVAFMSFVPMDIEVRLGVLFVYFIAQPLLLFYYEFLYGCIRYNVWP